MAAAFRTPGRRQGGDTVNIGSPSLIPTRAQQGTPSAPTTPHGTSSSEVGTNLSVSSDSRKRQSKKDEVALLTQEGTDQTRQSDVNWNPSWERRDLCRRGRRDRNDMPRGR